MTAKILIVNNEKRTRELSKAALAGIDGKVEAPGNLQEALHLIKEKDFDVVVTNLRLDDAGDSMTKGLDILDAVHKKNGLTPVIVTTEYPELKVDLSSENASEPMKVTVGAMAMFKGAFAVVECGTPGVEYTQLLRKQVMLALEYHQIINSKTDNLEGQAILNNRAYVEMKHELEEKNFGKYVCFVGGHLVAVGSSMEEVITESETIYPTSVHRLVLKVGEEYPEIMEEL